MGILVVILAWPENRIRLLGSVRKQVPGFLLAQLAPFGVACVYNAVVDSRELGGYSLYVVLFACLGPYSA